MYKRPMQSINNRANNWMMFPQTKALNDPVLSSGSSSVALATVPSPLWRKSNEAIGLDDNDASLSSGYGGYYCDNGINLAILILTLIFSATSCAANMAAYGDASSLSAFTFMPPVTLKCNMS